MKDVKIMIKKPEEKTKEETDEDKANNEEINE